MKKTKELKLSVPKAMPQRSELVQLEACDADGEQIVVLCEALRAVDAVKEVQRFPGAIVNGEKPDEASAMAQAGTMVELFQRLIAKGTALARPGGGYVRPAFWFDEAAERDELSLDGRCLPVMDITEMGTTILRLSGYAGGAAHSTFREAQ